MNIKVALALTLALLLLVFTAQNYQSVEVRMLFWKVEMSRSLLMLGMFASGLGAGWLVASIRRVHKT